MYVSPSFDGVTEFEPNRDFVFTQMYICAISGKPYVLSDRWAKPALLKYAAYIYQAFNFSQLKSCRLCKSVKQNYVNNSVWMSVFIPA